ARRPEPRGLAPGRRGCMHSRWRYRDRPDRKRQAAQDRADAERCDVPLDGHGRRARAPGDFAARRAASGPGRARSRFRGHPRLRGPAGARHRRLAAGAGMMAQPQIPVSVLTGFLGSGKTTLLANLLRQPELSRAAVIINEFGEIGLDHELVEASDDTVVALTTGCLCCKVRSDLTETLYGLLRRRAAGALPQQFDHIVIETSGLADPAPILHALMTDADLAARVSLGSVVTTVDAVAGEATLAREAVSRKQVAVADRIVLSKLDLTGGDAAALRARLAALNPAAPTLRAVRGHVDAADLFAGAASNPRRGESDIDAWLGDAPAHGHQHHDAEIKAYTLVRAAPIRAVA